MNLVSIKMALSELLSLRKDFNPFLPFARYVI